MTTYRHIRDRYLRDHPRCEAAWVCIHPVRGVPALATEVHHKQGRLGARLSDSGMFMAVCFRCHRHIHEHPAESKERGFMLSRNAND